MENSARSAVHVEVMEALASILNLDASKFQSDKSLADSGIDSLGLVEAVFGIEERFDISVPFNANDQVQQGGAALQSMGQLLDQVVDLVLARRVEQLAPESV